MSDGLSPKTPGRPRGRSFENGQSGNPAGRQVGSRDKVTNAAAALLEGEAEVLTRKAVELALAGDADVTTFVQANQNQHVERRLKQAEDSLRRQGSAHIGPAGFHNV